MALLSLNFIYKHRQQARFAHIPKLLCTGIRYYIKKNSPYFGIGIHRDVLKYEQWLLLVKFFVILYIYQGTKIKLFKSKKKLVLESNLKTKNFNKCVCVLSCSVMSNSLWPHGPQPARLLCPQNFPGKSTGLGCYFLLHGNLPKPGVKNLFFYVLATEDVPCAPMPNVNFENLA